MDVAAEYGSWREEMARLSDLGIEHAGGIGEAALVNPAVAQQAEVDLRAPATPGNHGPIAGTDSQPGPGVNIPQDAHGVPAPPKTPTFPQPQAAPQGEEPADHEDDTDVPTARLTRGRRRVRDESESKEKPRRPLSRDIFASTTKGFCPSRTVFSRGERRPGITAWEECLARARAEFGDNPQKMTAIAICIQHFHDNHPDPASPFSNNNLVRQLKNRLSTAVDELVNTGMVTVAVAHEEILALRYCSPGGRSQRHHCWVPRRPRPEPPRASPS
ncbi:hypothetical protein VTI74DRAFT_1187 [Chaetomium olivicolor]